MNGIEPSTYALRTDNYYDFKRFQFTSNAATILATAVIEAGRQWAKPPDKHGVVVEAET
jgi:hypothetical protein